MGSAVDVSNWVQRPRWEVSSRRYVPFETDKYLGSSGGTSYSTKKARPVLSPACWGPPSPLSGPRAGNPVGKKGTWLSGKDTSVGTSQPTQTRLRPLQVDLRWSSASCQLPAARQLLTSHANSKRNAAPLPANPPAGRCGQVTFRTQPSHSPRIPSHTLLSLPPRPPGPQAAQAKATRWPLPGKRYKVQGTWYMVHGTSHFLLLPLPPPCRSLPS